MVVLGAPEYQFPQAFTILGLALQFEKLLSEQRLDFLLFIEGQPKGDRQLPESHSHVRLRGVVFKQVRRTGALGWAEMKRS